MKKRILKVTAHRFKAGYKPEEDSIIVVLSGHKAELELHPMPPEQAANYPLGSYVTLIVGEATVAPRCMTPNDIRYLEGLPLIDAA